MSRLRWPDSTNSVSEKPGTIHWAHPTADPELGYVYLPLSTPANDYYGGTALEIICLARASYASMRRRVSASGTSRRCIMACGTTISQRQPFCSTSSLTDARSRRSLS